METTLTQYTITYWELPEEKVIIKRITETLVNQVQVKGEDLKGTFHHNWEKVTFPTKERLDKHLEENGFIPSTIEAYDKMLTDYFQINEKKRELYNQDRQRRYDNGTLKL